MGVSGLPVHYLKVVLLAVLSSSLLFPFFIDYKVWRGSSTLTEIRHLTMAWVMVALLLFVVSEL